MRTPHDPVLPFSVGTHEFRPSTVTLDADTGTATVSANASLLEVLELERAASDRFVGQNFLLGTGGVIFGGQILAQTVMVAGAIEPAKTVKSMYTTFSRGGDLSQPLEYQVDQFHRGRSISGLTVTTAQGARVCARTQVLLNADEPDFIRYEAPKRLELDPADAVPSSHGEGFWEIRTVDGVDIVDPEPVGPPELLVWSRFPGGPFSPLVSQALLAYASDGFLIGTAMRPHPGIGQALSHTEIATTVITQAITFLEPFDSGEWLLLHHESPHAGSGRSFGRADVRTRDGRMVASFIQENMIRAMS